MKEAYWGYWLIVLGIFIIVVLLLVQNFTSTNSQDFYLVKEIAEAAVEDAIDYGYYRTYGEAKINKEKFYESFIRRFAEEASLSTTYDIEFTEVYEAPPKIGVKVSSKSNSFSVFGDSETFDIVHKIDAILESKMAGSTTTVHEGEASYRGGTTDDIVKKCFEDYNTTSEFTGKTCSYKGYTIIVDYCGKLDTSKAGSCGIASPEEGTYCSGRAVGDSTITLTAPYDQFINEYCN